MTLTTERPPASDEELLTGSATQRVCELSTVKFAKLSPGGSYKPVGSYPCGQPAKWIVYTADGGCGHFVRHSSLVCEAHWKGISDGKNPFACGRCSTTVRILHAERIA